MTVILYSTGCPKCRVLKKKLADKHIIFEENNSVEEMESLGLVEVPALSVDGDLLEFSKAIQWVNNI